MISLGNDAWEGAFTVEEPGFYSYAVGGWIDWLGTWRKDLRKSRDAGQEVGVKLLVGAGYLEEAAKRATGPDRERLRQIAAILSNREDTEHAVSVGLGDELAVLIKRKFHISSSK